MVRFTIAWHRGFGGMHSEDLPLAEAIELISRLKADKKVDWIQVVGVGVR
jgi:hypothetical protein